MENQIKIKILDKEFVIKQSFRALALFEKATGRNSFEAKDTISDITLLLHCFLKASNLKTFEYTYDEFLDVLDDHPEIFQDFAEYLKGLNPDRGTNLMESKKKRKK